MDLTGKWAECRGGFTPASDATGSDTAVRYFSDALYIPEPRPSHKSPNSWKSIKKKELPLTSK